MRKKDQKKGITDDTIKEIYTVSILLKRINEEYEKRQKEVEIQDRANAEKLIVAEKEERRLIAEISEAKGIVGKMIADFGKIEADVEIAESKKIEENVVREADVKSGKVSLGEFREKGKYDAKIAEESLARSVQELEISLGVVRSKNLEILRLQDKLGTCRNVLRGLHIQPGIITRDLFKTLYEFSDDQVAGFSNELESLRTEWNQTKQDILLAQGKSLAGRHVWTSLNMAEARARQFSPLLPISCIEKLKSELAKYEGSDGISITLYVNQKDIEITSIMPRRSGAIQITQLKEMPGAKFTRAKAGK
ncbi:hypothetical protein E3J84_04070 [Candidatus Aerophobetes bacterium]|uniref:Uncharacterized protein n=1 Tax=Aerophobetes bacterium TaxID=2030807 RepID=A0A523RXB5_UNCAE|nr:MAG: hypothetical protein E3J84_04070 [Candidatus Aerophobetes bacterium]